MSRFQNLPVSFRNDEFEEVKRDVPLPPASGKSYSIAGGSRKHKINKLKTKAKAKSHYKSKSKNKKTRKNNY
jgi:hypothetical protein